MSDCENCGGTIRDGEYPPRGMTTANADPADRWCAECAIGPRRYRTIVADPPWSQKYSADTTRGPHGARTIRQGILPYPTLTIAELCELPVRDMVDKAGCNVFLWTTNSQLPHAFAVLEAWGTPYRQTLVWRKTNPLTISGTGSAAVLDLEFLLVGRRSGCSFTSRLDSSVIHRANGVTKGGLDGSHKPDLFLDLVESVSPGPYLELFARRQRLGWDTWGDEALEHVDLAAGGSDV